MKITSFPSLLSNPPLNNCMNNINNVKIEDVTLISNLLHIFSRKNAKKLREIMITSFLLFDLTQFLSKTVSQFQNKNR